ncbi:MAG: restriction endonuclease subunit S [Chitinophagales bacterium]|jgi:type I restriction enzyme S subunit|nr:restriction endonuclease subunit S [Sphingobacteriales bacterium]
MKSNYKPIGKHIRLVDERNKGLQVQQLLGLSISKQFIPSVANTIGTDMSTYRIIERNQFACSTMQVRRDKKMPVALLKDLDEAIISQAYPIFEVKDEKELLPEYLMMWFERSEFDREACFHTVGGVRGSLEWEDFENMQLPIPPIAKQREIVKEYNVIQNRIALNQQLIQKLEETAQAIYREWFVEVGFDETTFLKEYVETNPRLELRKGKISPYVEMANLSETSMCVNGKVEREYQGGSRFQNNDTLLARITPCLENGKTAFVNILKEKEIAAGSTEFIVMRAKKNISPFWVYCLAKDEGFRAYAISSMIGSSGRQRVHEKYLEEYQLPIIDYSKMEIFHNTALPIFESVKLKSLENQKLKELKEMLLSRLATVV